MHRFFQKITPQQDIFDVKGETFTHISKVLRLEVMEKVIFCDGEGWDFLCEIVSFSRDALSLRVLSFEKNAAEPKLKIKIYQCLPKGDKFESVIKRAVQFGVYDITPVQSARCIAVINEKSRSKKIERYNQISRSSAMQSGRGIIPRVNNQLSFKDAIAKMADDDLSVICYEKECKRSIKDVLATNTVKVNTFSLLIGPEGGLTEEEVEYAYQNGIVPVGLGRRILRTEDAAAFVMPIIFCLTGEL